jgi:competence protein ComEC
VDALPGESSREAMAFSRALQLSAALSPPQLPARLAEDNRNRDDEFLDARESEAVGWRRHLADLLAEEEAHGRFFLLLPVFLGLGAILWLSLAASPPAGLGLVSLPLIIAAATCNRAGRRGWSCALMASGLILAGTGLAQVESLRNDTIVLDTPVTTQIEGLVEKREAAAGGRWRYTVRILTTAAPVITRPPERAVLLSRTAHQPFETGTRIAGRARLSPPSGPALPGLADFAFSAYFQGIGAVGFFYGSPQKVGIGTHEHWSTRILGKLYELRSDIGTRIRAIVPGDAGAFAAAIVTDERRAIWEKTIEALRVAGLAHIVAISGLNMALAAGIFFVGARVLLSLFSGFAQRFPVKKIAALGALAMVTAYYLISGFGVSAERAYVMMVIMLASVLFDRPSISLHNVALSALVILVLSPSAVLGPSFQMSFSATAALVAGYAAWSSLHGDPHDPLAARRPAVLAATAALSSMVAGVVLTSLIGALSTSIFSVSHFHRVATYGLAGNLAAMPIISLIVMPFGMLAMLLMPFGLEAPFLKLMGFGVEMVISVAETVASWGGDVPVGRQHGWFLPVASLGFLLLVLLRTRLKLLGLPVIAAALILSFWTDNAARPSLLVSDDASLVALIDGQTAATNRKTPPDFIYGQWQNALMIDRTLAPIMPRRTTAAKTQDLPPDPLKSAPARPAADAAPSRQMATDADADKPASEIAADIRAVAPEESNPAGTSDADALQLNSGRTETGASPRKPPDPPLTKQQLREAATAMDKAMTSAPPGQFTCIAGLGCFARSREKVRIATIEDPRYAGTACDTADIVIAARARFETCRSGALILTGTTLRKTGSLEIRFAGSTRRLDWQATGASLGNKRPWSIHRTYDWRRRIHDDTLPQPVASLLSDSGG